MNLLASNGAWVLDVIFFVLMLSGLVIGCWRGFIKSVCKIAGTIFAIITAIAFCAPLSNSLESTFGLTTALAQSVKQPAAGVISIILSFIFLVVLVKLGAWLVGKFGTAIVEKSQTLKKVNRFLGGLFGLFRAFFFLLILLAILKWIGSGAINDFMNDTAIVKHIYEWDWFSWAMNLPFVTH